MLLTRYEFGGTGIFHAIDLLYDCDMERADAEDLERSEYILDRDLQCPDIDWKDVRSEFRCWFTEKGITVFREELDIMAYLYRKYPESTGMGEMRIVQKEIAEQSIVYQDDFQVVTISIDPSHSCG